MHRHDDSIEVLDRGDRPLPRSSRAAPRPAAARPVRARPPSCSDDGRPARSRRRASAGWRHCGSSSDVLAPACISVDHPRFLSFVPAAPTEARSCSTSSSVRRASTPARGSRALARSSPRTRRCAGSPTWPGCLPAPAVCSSAAARPATSSALVAARWEWRARAGGAHDRTRGLIVASTGAHSSVAQAARAMDADVVAGAGRRAWPPAPATPCAPRSTRWPPTTAPGCSPSSPRPARRTPASSTTSPARPPCAPNSARGCTSTARTAAPRSAAPSVRQLFAGIERADSFIVDPHKWLFAPFDSCALLYRDPAIARAAHTQHAEYLDVLHAEHPTTNRGTRATTPTTCRRRARGLPFWFSLATHGTDAYTEAVETTLQVDPRPRPADRGAPTPSW